MHYPPEQEVFTVATHHSSHDKDGASSSSSSKFATVQNSSLCRSPSARWFVGALMVLLSLSLVHNFRKGLFSEVHDHPLDKNQSLHQRSVRFMPYPHKTLGSGTSLQCQWETRPFVSSNTSKESYLDFTQQNAYAEGICIPPTLNDTLHIFSSEEAIECLSPKAQNRDIKLMLSGDSYMKQLYIGLADILLSKHINNGKEIVGATQRNEVTTIAQHEMEKRRSEEKNSTFPFVQYGPQCYGLVPLSEDCLKVIKELGTDNSTDYVFIISSGVHIYRRSQNQVNATIQEINNFLDTTNRTIFVSPPYYYPDIQFTAELVRDQAEVYRGLLPNVAPENADHPFLDVYELTRSCMWKNCSYDKAHRSRFVNRWKAQLLLNTLCEVQ
ncbi:hypothetical protein QTG54_016041 [Skeletonema marinoi]|uniref:SGNH domain-containing protein n=1 Tax=Skeletonema marinoi TaxID=267567 RepID=A0AAD8XTJ5_9STRA|nr:hypothetical protein QTG54_016041 [Skeletonema marinoi]